MTLVDNCWMRLYTLEELPPRVETGVRLSPVSLYVLKNADVNLNELLPDTLTDLSSCELANRKMKKLDILRSIRRKMLDNEYDLHQMNVVNRLKNNNDEMRNRDRLNYVDGQSKQQRKRSSKYSSKAARRH